MKKGTGFRCPFDTSGHESGTIHRVALSDSKAERLAMMEEALKSFHANLSITAIQLVLPDSVLVGLDSPATLEHVALPFQTELYAVELEMRLNPCLSYHGTLRDLWKWSRNRGQCDTYELAYHFERRMRQYVRSDPQDVMELSDRLADVFRRLRQEVPRNYGLAVSHQPIPDGPWFPLMSVEEGTIRWPRDESRDREDVFHIVQAPCYHIDWPRHSERAQIIVTRHADVDDLPPEKRQSIRRRANEVYASHGVHINNLDTDHQSFGVWVPEYR